MWTRDEILSLVGTAPVFARDEDARLVALPEWLTRIHEAPPWDEQVSWIYVGDRPRVVSAWWESVGAPGEPIVVPFRSSRDRSEWHLVEACYLNLLDHPEVRAVLIVHDDQGVTAPPEGRDDDDFRATFEAPTWIIQHLDPIGEIVRTEGMVDAVFGRPHEELVGHNVLEYLHGEDHDAAIAMWLEVVGEPGATRTIRQRIVRPDGTDVWLESTVMNQVEQVGAVVAVSHDVSGRHRQELALRASERAFRALADGVPMAVFRATAGGEVTYANGRFEELVAPRAELTALPAIDATGQLATVWQALLEPSSPPVQVDIARPDGRTIRFRARAVEPASWSDGAVVIGTVDDVTLEVARTDELLSRVELDALTGLSNRAGLDRRAADALDRGATDVAFVFVDLDDFKAVNDTWGHLAGDAVLAEVALRLRGVVRPDDVVARYGGDEFVLLCSGLEPGDDPTLVRRIGKAISAPMLVAGNRWRPGASVGIVRPVPGETPAETLRRADQDMYRRKRRRA